MNYNNLLKAIEMITPEGLGMSPKRIMVSTGIPKMIKKLADDEVKFKLAVSLHSAIDEFVRESCLSVLIFLWLIYGSR
jgi:23S rRNA (adenine2503-C2)-methyltransferase